MWKKVVKAQIEVLAPPYFLALRKTIKNPRYNSCFAMFSFLRSEKKLGKKE
jgi:hypothetical protein